MTDQNPYAAPTTALDTGEADTYTPRIFSFDGRIGRVRYLAYGIGFNLLLAVVLVPILSIATVLGIQAGLTFLSLVVTGVFYVATFVVAVIFSRRRLNDLNRSGWWFLLFFIPVVNLLLAIYLVFFPGSRGPNRFGSAPAANSWGVIVLGLLFPVILLAGTGILAAIAIPQYANYAERSKLVGALAAAQPWKTGISICATEHESLAREFCGTPGINGVPADAGAGEFNYVSSITTTGAGVITITSSAVDNYGNALEIVLTPSLNSSGIEWAMSGSACEAAGRSLNCARKF